MGGWVGGLREERKRDGGWRESGHVALRKVGLSYLFITE
jgi:hypothetical protein